MKTLLRNLKIILVVFLAVSMALLAGLAVQHYRSLTRLYVAAGENKQALKTRYAQAGSIRDINGVMLAHSEDGERLYHEDKTTAKAVLHLVGDYTHNIDNTIEARYQSTLLGTDRNLLHQLFLDVQGAGLTGDDVTLTLDSSLAKKAWLLLDGRKGAIVLLNYKTGAILVSVSAPSASPASVVAYEDIADTSLYNRAFLGLYAPGSTFKIVTTAAILQSAPELAAMTITCTGQATVAPNGANESGHGHGPTNLASAFSKSCNIFFGQAGADMGLVSLIQTADSMGFGEPLKVDKLNVGVARIDSPDDPATLSWLAIGQPTGSSNLSMTPLQMAMLVGAIGNQGLMQQAHIIDHLTDPIGMDYARLKVQTGRSILSANNAATLEALLIDAVKNGTGSAAAIKGWTVAGKTGTVQVSGQKNNALFVGYIVDETLPLAIAVVVEEGGSGGKTAAPIAGSLLQDVTAVLSAKP